MGATSHNEPTTALGRAAAYATARAMALILFTGQIFAPDSAVIKTQHVEMTHGLYDKTRTKDKTPQKMGATSNNESTNLNVHDPR